MKRVEKYFLRTFLLLFVFGAIASIAAPIKKKIANSSDLSPFFGGLPPLDTLEQDQFKLPYPLPKGSENEWYDEDKNPLYLKEPSNIVTEVEYDPVTNTYIFYKRIGTIRIREPFSMTPEEYRRYEAKESIKDFWKSRITSQEEGGAKGIIPKIYVRNKLFESIFGSNTIDIRPQGSAEISFGLRSNFNDNPTRPVRTRRQTNFDFNQRIQMNVLAKIGDKIEFKANYNTEATFEFENKLKLRYEGKEDEIIQLIEAGDVSLPLNSQLIQGNQSLFGFKTQLKFGRTMVTGVFSQQNSEAKNITVQGGAQQNKFKATALDYEENKHFFISQYFRENYEKGVSELPVINSDVTITKIEVWVTNIGPPIQQNRNIVAFQDLGEGVADNIYYKQKIKPTKTGERAKFPDNNANTLYPSLFQNQSQVRNINSVSQFLQSQQYRPGVDFEKIEGARKLSDSEYSFNPRLGFISLNNISLSADQVLGVAFQYQVIGQDTATFQVGEFSDQGINVPDGLIVKLLKPTNTNTRLKLWDLMMKNVYKIDAYQINKEGFVLNILYQGGEENIPTGYFTDAPSSIKGTPLINFFGMDRLNQQLIPVPGGDGLFDFVDNASTQGGTIQSSNGRIFFTKLEPFGSYLVEEFRDAGNENLGRRYAFDSLYRTTKSRAEQFPDKNKFFLEGFYKSQGGSEINLNAFNVPQGSVKVNAGGRQLVENVDYVVDYTLGRVRIINEGLLNSGTPINISLESNSFFNIQKKTLTGLRIDHEINNDFHLGATIMNLRERPLTQKVNYGNDPINNTIWGADLHYSTESRWLTKMIDKIPLISTNKPSRITFDAEFAHFIPGHSKVVGSSGTSYIDDFDGTKSTIDLRNPYDWYIASTPQGQADMFPEATNPNSGLAFRDKAALFNWYYIDPLFYTNNIKPPGVPRASDLDPYNRQYKENDLFPNKQYGNAVPVPLQPLEVSYYPTERAPYNFSTNINQQGDLNNPTDNWGGMMRPISTTDFEAANVEFIEFWLLDPFLDVEEYPDNQDNGGELYINIGTVSEDVLRDGRKSFENGLPTSADDQNTPVDETIWGIVPRIQAVTESFSNISGSREFQDVGYDGMNVAKEREFFSGFIQEVNGIVGGGEPYQKIFDAPASDVFHYFRGKDYDDDKAIYGIIRNRYKKFNNPSGNTRENSTDIYSQRPNTEDINGDNTLTEFEDYFQYKINLTPDDLRQEGQNFIVDTKEIDDKNVKGGKAKWYQFKIPIDQYEKVIGNIEDFKSIRFMRVFLHGFKRPVQLRFATFDLVRNNWRKYDQSLLSPGEYIPDDSPRTAFEVGAVNLEENSTRTPVPYVLPPGVEREEILGTTNVYAQNEQSLDLKVYNLRDGDARGAFKTTDFDFRQYGKLKMFIHAENLEDAKETETGTLTTFLRIGSDFTQNYYEYEVPLKFTIKGQSGRDQVWPSENNVDIDLKELVKYKMQRNEAVKNPGSGVSKNRPYRTVDENGRTITILGNPSISDVQAILIGVRNPKSGSSGTDLGQPVSAEIWLNELRVTDFSKSGGWAATARMAADLADLGRLIISGSHSSAGFGSLEQRLDETSRESSSAFDISTDLDLGRFTPKQFGIRIPMHFDYSETHITPEYNPLDPDVKLDDQLKSFDTKAEKDSLNKRVVDFTKRKSINFINVRKEKVNSQSKNRVWDIENFSVSYSYSEMFHRNIDIEYERERKFNGGFAYNFNISPKPVRPFYKLKFLKSKHLAFIRDFNFFYVPKTLTFNTQMNRLYQETKYRAKSAGDIIIYPTRLWDWDWNRNYAFRYDLTRSISIDFNANAMAYVNEPAGLVANRSQDAPDYWKPNDEVWENIWNFGELRNYNQKLNITYNLPFSKFTPFDWINGNAGYSANYIFTVPSINLAYKPENPNNAYDYLGNNLENSNTKQLNLNFDFVKLYNKIGYLKKLNMASNNRSPRYGGSRSLSLRSAGKVKDKDKEGSEADSTKRKGPNYFKLVGDNVLKLLMGVKKAGLKFSEGNGTFLPGYIYDGSYFAYNFDHSAPGWEFILGSEKDIYAIASDKQWLTRSDRINTAYSKKYNRTIGFNATIEPIKDLKIDLIGDRTIARSSQHYYRYDPNSRFYQIFSPVESGSFSMSYALIGTSFVSPNSQNISKTFQNFLESRRDIALLLAEEDNRVDLDNPNDWIPYDTLNNGTLKNYYPKGYGPNSRQVIHHAFLTAYRGVGASKANLETFPTIPIPNWNIRYTGLNNVEFLKEYFKNISLNHSYSSTYAISSFRTNVNYVEGQEVFYPNTFNYIGNYEIDQIVLTERFAPLGGIDVTMQNDMSIRLAYNKTRNLALSFVNNQLTEVLGSEIIVGLGYRIKNLALNFIGASSRKAGKGKKTQSSDLNIKADIGIRNDKTTIRWINQSVNQVTAGQRVITINSTADYMVTPKINLTLYFERTDNTPFVTTAYRTSQTNFGFKLRFNLAQ
ncbi:MAG: cell surface protein SprA [Hyphomicrobiales bacterium]